MNDPAARERTPADATPGAAALPPAGVRIEYDRKRLVAATLASGLAAAAAWAGLIVTAVHIGTALVPLEAAPALRVLGVPHLDVMPWWVPLAIAPAALVATFRFLGCMFRLQDGDPAFVLSPRGLQFRPSPFAERVRVPWHAIRSIQGRRFKNQRGIVLHIDDVERYVPRTGLLGPLRRLGDAVAGGGTVRLRTPMSQASWQALIAVLQQSLILYRSPAESLAPRST